MKKIKSIAILIASCMVFLAACNSGGEKKATDATTDTTAAKTDSTVAVAPPPAPVPAGPVMIMSIRHKVANYAKWKVAYESHDSARVANGLHNYVIARGIDDSNMVLVAVKMDDVEKAKAMANSASLKERMKAGGVVGTPIIDYIETVMNDTTAIQQTVRVLVKEKVKDWTAWRAAFDGGQAMRDSAGLTTRLIGHTVGDDHSVGLVFAIADVAKAKAFFDSKRLKDAMAKAGVQGAPTRFYYKIVHKY